MNWYKKSDVLKPIEQKLWEDIMKKNPYTRRYAPSHIEKPDLYNPKNEIAMNVMNWILGLPVFCNYDDPESLNQQLRFENEYGKMSPQEVRESLIDVVNYKEAKGNIIPQTEFLASYIGEYLEDYYNEYAETKGERAFITKILQTYGLA